MTVTTKPETLDFTRMALGTVTRVYKGRTVGAIARCPKCGKHGERSASIPGPEEATRRRPYVHVTHSSHIAGVGGLRFNHVDESCTISLDKSNVEDLLNLEERKQYDVFTAALRAYVEVYA